MKKQIIYYYTINGECPYKDWYNSINKSIQIRIDKRIEKLEDGLYGDHKLLQNSSLSELRMDFGKGYRIYYYDIDNTIIIFFTGSDKSNQKKIIKKADIYYKDYIERTKL